MLGVTNPDLIADTTQRVLSFQSSDGTFADPFVLRKRRIRTFLGTLKRGQLPRSIDEDYIRAETRQAYAALWIHDRLPDFIPLSVTTDSHELTSYLSSLDWTNPWSAGSHLSHQLFFLTLLRNTGTIDETTYTQAVQTIQTFLTGIQQTNGSWYTGSPSARQRVNGAMKVLSGLTLIGAQAPDSKALIDLCLTNPAQAQHDACDQINQILVLRYANEWCGGTHRHKEIQAFCEKTLHEWSVYYHAQVGGFSFHRDAANRHYYGARVTRGLNEPDIHATVLFFWGLSLMKHLLPIRRSQRFQTSSSNMNILKTPHLIRVILRGFRPYRRELSALVALGFLGGVLEGIGINALIPFLGFILGDVPETSGLIMEAVRSLFELFQTDLSLRILFFLIGGLFILKAFVLLAFQVVSASITSEYERRERERLFGSMLGADWLFLSREKMGYLDKALTLDITGATNLLRVVSMLILSLTNLCIYSIVAFSISSRITLIALIAGAIFFLRSNRSFGKRLKQRVALQKTTNALVTL